MTVFANDVGTQLLQGVFSWQFLQFVVTFVVAFGFVLTSATFLSYVDRKVLALVQDRLGPYHTGPQGLLQPVADVVKLLLKEDIHSSSGDKWVFLLAPAVFLAPIIGAFAVLPFSPYIELPGIALATGIVYYVAMSSIDVIGVIMAGWGSNNKYSLIGGLRSAAQMISYELPLVLALVSIVMLTSVLAGGNSGIGTVSIKEIMQFQDVWHNTNNPILDFLFGGFTPWAWFLLVQPLMLLVYFICGVAETNRPPFDLPEAESELVAGYLTEYSGARWAMFFLGEYGNMTIVSAIATYLFLGGWSGPGVSYLTGLGTPVWGLIGNVLALIYFVTKVYFVCFIFVWVRATLPRLRADQLMQFAWLILIPLTLGNILLTGLIYLLANSLGLPNWVFLIVLALVNWAGVAGFIWWVRRATTSATLRAQAPAIHAQRRESAVPALQLSRSIEGDGSK
ncbi:MAG: NADH-quinone oxidoreductase subunit NuoH [Chloroflexi bacterium]|nr:MAG: NADH-quinone oxidoreductase subunit NuoH [Chloroflexota bacterium]